VKQVHLKPKRALPFYARHPWVFNGAIDRADGPPAPGSEVELVTSTGDFVARGLYNPASKINVRLYSWDAEERLDEAFFRKRLEAAIRLRHDWLKLNHGPDAAYRVVFSEADGLSGMVADRYGDYVTVQFTALGLAQRRDMLGRLLQELLGVKGVYVRTEKGVGQLEGLEIHDGLLCGEMPPGEVVIRENGLRFAVNLTEGQKTGYYLDQRDNRAAVAKLSAGRRVLDAFCYSGGFGVTARHAGAAEVECVDASEAALKLAARNAELNDLDGITLTKGDVFGHLDKLAASGRKFDLIVLDPPKFARNRAALPAALQGYRKLHLQALKVLDRDGVLVSCCCTGLITPVMLEEIVAQAAADARRGLQILERRGPSADHPVAASCRESAYLKCLVSRAE
jgi:23S rRNA (cytosine1962-C5)-methyltransferase